MFVLFTDFGLSGPYTGQMKAVLGRIAPGIPAIDLFADAPAFDSQASAYLLAAYAAGFPAADIFLCVVDPGVGTDRRPVAVRADRRWFVGPDNGLLALVVRRAARVAAWEIAWRPDVLSATFHGRDLFAPVAGRLALGVAPPGPAIDPASLDRPDWPDDLAQVVYVDGYGNLMTGLRAARLEGVAWLEAGGRRIPGGRTFGERPAGAAFWYENANGLVEIAVNQGRADAVLGLSVGAVVAVHPGAPSADDR